MPDTQPPIRPANRSDLPEYGDAAFDLSSGAAVRAVGRRNHVETMG